MIFEHLKPHMPTIQRIETLAHGKQCLVRITDSDGATGLGQTAPNMLSATVPILHDLLASLALGRDTDDHAGLDEVVWRKAYKYTGTFLYRALAGIDTALWDLRARRQGVPVRDLLGDGRHDTLPVYGSSLSRDRSPAAEAEFIRDGLERFGCPAFKIKIAGRRGRDIDVTPGRTEGVVQRVRDVLPESIPLMVDANGGYSPDKAIAVGRFLNDLGVCHFEEPCPHEEIDQTGLVTAALAGLPIEVAGGEQDYLMPVFDRLAGERLVDRVQCDIGYCGGLTRALRVAERVDRAGLALMPHSPNPSMIFLFTLHLIASRPAERLQLVEYNLGSEVGAGLFTPTITPADGRVALPPDPAPGLAPGSGFGVEPDPAFIEKAEVRTSAL
ncbi:MAG: mandelate racemase/muconate lactonizing enzyme family protein [Planctomycetota bacterium]